MARVALIFGVVLSFMAVSVQGLNITSVLEAFPNYGLFNEWLSLTGVANEVNSRTGLTLLATTNSSLQSYISKIHNASVQPGLGMVADALRYQILLTYYGIPELNKINLNNYTEVTTLLQTTGRTNDSAGFVDIYHVNDTAANGGPKLVVGHFTPGLYDNATILSSVASSPYSYSVLQLSSFLEPPPTTLPAPLPSPKLAPAPTPGAASPPAPPTTGSTIPPPGIAPKPSYASRTGVRMPLPLVALFMASMAVLL